MLPMVQAIPAFVEEAPCFIDDVVELTLGCVHDHVGKWGAALAHRVLARHLGFRDYHQFSPRRTSSPQPLHVPATFPALSQATCLTTRVRRAQCHAMARWMCTRTDASCDGRTGG